MPSTTFTPLPTNTASATMTATATETSSQTNTLTATHTLVAPSETSTSTFMPVASTETLVPIDTATTTFMPSASTETHTATAPAEVTDSVEITTTATVDSNAYAIRGLESNASPSVSQFGDTPSTNQINQTMSYLTDFETTALSPPTVRIDDVSLPNTTLIVAVPSSFPPEYGGFSARTSLPALQTSQLSVTVNLNEAHTIFGINNYNYVFPLIPSARVQHYYTYNDVNGNIIEQSSICDDGYNPNNCRPIMPFGVPNVWSITVHLDYIDATHPNPSSTFLDNILFTASVDVTPTATPINCSAISFAQIQGSAPQSSDGDDSCPNPDIEQELEEYGILTEGNWSLLELDEMLQGIEKVALAFQEFSTQPYSSPQEAFKEIMLFETTTQHIVMVKLSPPNDDEFCTTNTVPSGMQRASITCGGGNLFTEFTMVHELGHVFLNQTVDAIPVNVSVMPCQSTTTNEVGFIFCIETPRNDTRGSALRGIPVNTFVFGFISRIRNADQITELVDRFDSSGVYNVSANEFSYSCSDGAMLDSNTGLCTNNIPPTTIVSDWERGERGWDGVQLEGFGACANASNDYTTSNFQQNPCTIIDWILQASSSVDAATLSEIKVVEQEETGADMFLNWIYRSVDLSSDAFSDNEGQDIDIYLNSEGPGDDRFFWMEDVLNEFFSYYQW